MAIVDWDTFGTENKRGDKSSTFLKLEPNKSYKIRIIGKPYIIWKYWIDRPDGQSRRAITEDPKSCIIATKYNESPKQRFAVTCFDRSDGKLKILEGPMTILRSIGAWYQESKVEPGSNKAGDFAIKVERQGNDARTTRYTVMFLNYVPFTKDEVETYKTSGFDLAEIFQPVPQDKIEEVLYGEGQDSGEGKKSSSKSSKSSKAELSDDLDF
jgi:hypothetical protein